MYQVLLTKGALETLQSFDIIVQEMIMSYLKKQIGLSDDPKSIGENFGGSDNIWRYRIGKYRVLTVISDIQKKIIILSIVRGYQSKSYAIPPVKGQVHDEVYSQHVK